MSVQLFSGVKIALESNPDGFSLASITMQRTSEAQRAAQQSYFMGTGALTHAHSREEQQHMWVPHMQVPGKPHACVC